MVRAPSSALTSSSASPVSQGCTPLLPSQASFPQKGAPPSGVCQTSIAPGLTLGSQSLQSPSAGVQPSPSMSAFMSVTTQFVPEPVVPTPVTLPIEMLPPVFVPVLPGPAAPEPAAPAPPALPELVNELPAAEHAAPSAMGAKIRRRVRLELRSILLLRRAGALRRRAVAATGSDASSLLLRLHDGGRHHGNAAAVGDPLEVVDQGGRVEVLIAGVPHREADGDRLAALHGGLRGEPARRAGGDAVLAGVPDVEARPDQLVRALRAVGVGRVGTGAGE